MAATVRPFVRSCNICKQAKPQQQKPAGLLQPLPVPTRRWSCIATDFDLPLTASGCDSIMTVIDRLSKMAHFVPTKKTVKAPEVARLFFDNIVRIHKMPESIISGRHPEFTGEFLASLLELAEASRDFSEHTQHTTTLRRMVSQRESKERLSKC
eukprot:GHVN01012050.1.p2 GENE.GHVN01012050.1~~GHVN01012050.1.p2  ORF type:complete len:154 (+),score=15.90 GHVN01012050.1:1977-2438(+)